MTDLRPADPSCLPRRPSLGVSGGRFRTDDIYFFFTAVSARHLYTHRREAESDAVKLRARAYVDSILYSFVHRKRLLYRAGVWFSDDHVPWSYSIRSFFVTRYLVLIVGSHHLKRVNNIIFAVFLSVFFFSPFPSSNYELKCGFWGRSCTILPFSSW